MTYDQAGKCVDEIFKDLRDRRFLKWLFDAHPDYAGPILHKSDGEPLMPLDSAVQNEIREAWIGILMEFGDRPTPQSQAGG